MSYAASFKRTETRESGGGLINASTKLKGRNYGPRNAVVLAMSEDSVYRLGVPSFIRTAILLERPSHGRFNIDVAMKTDVSGFSFNTFKDGLLTDKPEDDPILMDPDAPCMWPEKWSVDHTNLGSMDLSYLYEASTQSKLISEQMEEIERQDNKDIEKLVGLGQNRPQDNNSESWYVDLWNMKPTEEQWDKLPKQLCEEDLQKCFSWIGISQVQLPLLSFMNQHPLTCSLLKSPPSSTGVGRGVENHRQNWQQKQWESAPYCTLM